MTHQSSLHHALEITIMAAFFAAAALEKTIVFKIVNDLL